MPDEVTPKIVDRTEVRRLVVFLGVALVVCLVLGILYQRILLPFFISAFFTYLLLPLTQFLEKHKIHRTWTILAIILFLVGLIALASFLMLPVIYDEALGLLQLAPKTWDVLVTRWLPFLKKSIVDLRLISEQDFNSTLQNMNISGQVAYHLQQSLKDLWSTASGIPHRMLTIILVPLITFFLLKDYNKIVTHLGEVIPGDIKQLLIKLITKMDYTLKAVIKGQITVAFILGVLYVIGLTAIGLPASLTIGVVAGICRIIPYFDVIVGVILSIIVLVSDFSGWGQVIGVFLVFLIVQILDGMFITPKIIGQKIGLHPGVVILSVIAFGDLFGFLGVLLAIPMVAVIKVLWEAVLPYYYSSKIYSLPKKD